ncbi:MAG: hypothetical protein ABIW79_11090 [Gemmatimonas sp.]
MIVAFAGRRVDAVDTAVVSADANSAKAINVDADDAPADNADGDNAHVSSRTASRSRFPAKREPRVREDLRVLFTRVGASVLVASAACGADIIAHEVAGTLGMRRVLLLPTEPSMFRAESVSDRGDGWGERYDLLLREVAQQGDVRVVRLGASLESYRQLNEALLDVAEGVAERTNGAERVLAVAAWDGESYGDDDVTAAFINAARRREMAVEEVRTS